MKTPKQKAEELVQRYFWKSKACTSLENAKRYAIIAVDETIANLLSLFDKGLKDVHISFDSPKQTHRDVIYPEVEYWQEVKNELQKM